MVALTVAVAAACSPVRYANEGETGDRTPVLARTVTYTVERAFYSEPPRCVIVMPFDGPGDDRRRGALVEAAFARHLALKVGRVVDPARRNREARDRALDLDRDGDRRRLARDLGCDALLEGATVAADATFALVWAEVRFGISASLERSEDGRLMWRASHTAERSAGGLPLSVLSLPVDAYSAGRLMNDGDVLPSMVDDVVRRLMASLPDARGLW
ncbi:MAG: hypothetical protein A3J29_00560 [Acidobacteria bacterium RIFCSPLOWO2_12_FULL_67_14b]|nr:MAG: hypothetical protein A3J29_00560 [Acidobacteria bacterium RIFCSPLOWO2_12_FULL_67_14b]